MSVFLALAVLLSACNLPGTTQQLSPPEETATAGVLATEVAQTIQAESAGDDDDSASASTDDQTGTPNSSSEGETSASPTPNADSSTSPSPTVVHQVTPASPGPTDKFITDRSTRPYASEQRAIADNFDTNFLERPYTAQDMEYKPWLDLTRAEISTAAPWIYVVFSLEEGPPDDSQALYGVEPDLDIDGRGDWLIWGQNPAGTDWTVADVAAYEDANDDVGRNQPMSAEGPAAAGDGFEQEVFDSGQGNDPDTAWIRQSPSSASDIQIAFKHSLIASASEFLWGGWTENGLKEPGSFDYHDTLTIEEAGSPVSSSEYYPVQQLAEVDNTCRWAFGFDPTRNLPGMCSLPATPTPTSPPRNRLTPSQGLCTLTKTRMAIAMAPMTELKMPLSACAQSHVHDQPAKP
ncbi:MAG: hypothetical protein ACLFWD_08760 [Anaerolineales bacterium]